MVVLAGNLTQYCSDQSHDGVWSGSGKTDPTRKLWPFHNFRQTVVAYNAGTTKAVGEPSALPVLDITLEV